MAKEVSVSLPTAYSEWQLSRLDAPGGEESRRSGSAKLDLPDGEYEITGALGWKIGFKVSGNNAIPGAIEPGRLGRDLKGIFFYGARIEIPEPKGMKVALGIPEKLGQYEIPELLKKGKGHRAVFLVEGKTEIIADDWKLQLTVSGNNLSASWLTEPEGKNRLGTDGNTVLVKGDSEKVRKGIEVFFTSGRSVFQADETAVLCIVYNSEKTAGEPLRLCISHNGKDTALVSEVWQCESGCNSRTYEFPVSLLLPGSYFLRAEVDGLNRSLAFTVAASAEEAKYMATALDVSGDGDTEPVSDTNAALLAPEKAGEKFFEGLCRIASKPVRAGIFFTPGGFVLDDDSDVSVEEDEEASDTGDEVAQATEDEETDEPDRDTDKTAEATTEAKPEQEKEAVQAELDLDLEQEGARAARLASLARHFSCYRTFVFSNAFSEKQIEEIYSQAILPEADIDSYRLTETSKEEKFCGFVPYTKTLVRVGSAPGGADPAKQQIPLCANSRASVAAAAQQVKEVAVDGFSAPRTAEAFLRAAEIAKDISAIERERFATDGNLRVVTNAGEYCWVFGTKSDETRKLDVPKGSKMMCELTNLKAAILPEENITESGSMEISISQDEGRLYTFLSSIPKEVQVRASLARGENRLYAIRARGVLVDDMGRRITAVLPALVQLKDSEGKVLSEVYRTFNMGVVDCTLRMGLNNGAGDYKVEITFPANGATGEATVNLRTDQVLPRGLVRLRRALEIEDGMVINRMLTEMDNALIVAGDVNALKYGNRIRLAFERMGKKAEAVLLNETGIAASAILDGTAHEIDRPLILVGTAQNNPFIKKVTIDNHATRHQVKTCFPGERKSVIMCAWRQFSTQYDTIIVAADDAQGCEAGCENLASRIAGTVR